MPTERKQRNRVMVNLTDAEYEELLEAAEDEPLSSFARGVLLRFLARRRRR